MNKYSKGWREIQEDIKYRERKARVLGYLMYVFIMIVTIWALNSCSSSPEVTEFTVSTCPPYCDNDPEQHCDEVSYDDDGNKICTNYGRW